MSETFIAAQMAAMTRWEPRLVGLRRHEPALAGVQPFFLAESGRGGRRRGAFESRILAPRRFRSAAIAADARLVHAHFVTDAVRATRFARAAGLPLIVTAHGYDVTTHRARHLDLGGVFSYASSFVAVSAFIADELRGLGAPAEKIQVLPIGIEVPPPPTKARRSDLIVFVGRLVEKKGCDDLLEAVARLAPDVRPEVRVVGDGPLRPQLEQKAAELGVRASFLGGQPPTVVRQELARATVFCAPSKRASDGDAEGFGMVFLEAGAAETPVVSYRSAGVVESVADGESGLLAPEGDVAALADALRALFADPALGRRLGTSGRARVQARFDIGACTRALEDAYDRVVAGSAR